MQVVATWSGGHADLLRQAFRMTNESYAEYLSVSVRTVANGCGSFEVSWLRCEDMAVAVSGVVDAFVLAAEVEAPVVLEVAGGDEGAELEDGLGAFESPSCARYVHSVLDDVPAGPFYDPGGDGPAFPQRGGVVQVVLLVLQVAGAFVGGGLALVEEGPGGLPQVFEHVDEVNEDRDGDAAGRGLRGDGLDLGAVAVHEDDPFALAAGVAAFRFAERGGDDGWDVIGDRGGQPLTLRLRLPRLPLPYRLRCLRFLLPPLLRG